MIRNAFSVTAASLLLALASACATDEGPARAAQPAPVEAAPVQVAAAAPGSKQEFHPDDMVCRVYEVTGSRVQQQRICKTRQQWIDEARLAREQFRGLQEQNAAQGKGMDGAVKGGN